MQDVWQYSTVRNSACKVIEEQTLWGQTVCRVWLLNQDAVVQVPRSALRPLNADLQPEIEAGRIAYAAAAAKVAEVLEGSTSATARSCVAGPYGIQRYPCRTRFTPCPAPSRATVCVTCWPTR